MAHCRLGTSADKSISAVAVLPSRGLEVFSVVAVSPCRSANPSGRTLHRNPSIAVQAFNRGFELKMGLGIL
jgi:hypothetical protein